MEVKLGDKVCLYRQRSVLIDPAFLEDADMITLQIYEEASIIKVNPKRFWVKPSSGGKQLKCDKQGGWVIYSGDDRIYASREDRVYLLTDSYKKNIDRCVALLENIDRIKKLKGKWLGFDLINSNYSEAKQVEIAFKLHQLESILNELEKVLDTSSRVYDEKALDFL